MADESNINAENDSNANVISSEDTKCCICYDKITDKSVPQNCDHPFCFKCIYKWSQMKPECPLCIQSFSSICFDFKDSGLLEKMVMPSNLSGTQTSFKVHFDVFDAPDDSILFDPFILRPLHIPLKSTRRKKQTSFRRTIYEEDVHVRLFDRRPDRLSPSFYLDNASEFNRLRPWVKRELGAIGTTDLNLNIMVPRFLNCLLRYHIRSLHFRFLLSQCIESEFIYHFIHEFMTFANSSLDMRGFDEKAYYPTLEFSPGSESESGSDSDKESKPESKSGSIPEPAASPAIPIPDSEPRSLRESTYEPESVGDIEVIYESPRQSASASSSSKMIVTSHHESPVVPVPVPVYELSSDEELPSKSVPQQSLRQSTNASSSSKIIVISDYESPVEPVPVPAPVPVPVYELSSDEEMPSVSQQSSSGSATPGPSSSASRPGITSKTRKRKRKHRKTVERAPSASRNEANNK